MPTLPASGYAYQPFPSTSPSMAAPQAYQRIQSTTADFGAAEGQALSQLGATVERAAGSLADQVVKEQELFNVTAAQEAANKFNEGTNALLYGNPDLPGDVGFMGKQGRAAMDAWPSVRDQLRKLKDAQRAVLQNTPQRLRFDSDVNDTINRKLSEAGRHYGQEMNQWNIATAQGTVKIAQQDAARAAASDDPALFDSSVATGAKAMQASLERAGQTPEQIQAALVDYRKESAVTWAQNVATRDPVKAREFIERNGALLGDKKAALLDHVRSRANALEATRLANASGGTRNFNYGASGALGDPREPGWEAKNLTTIAAPGGAKFKVHQAAAPAFQGLVNDLEGMGYQIKPGTSGGHNLRNRTGSTELSEHAYGTAIDINSDVNLFTRDGKKVTDLPLEVGELARKHGLIWGGNWRDPVDTMHFQWAGPGGVELPPDKVDNVNVRANNFGGIRRKGVTATAAEGGFEAYPSAQAGVKAVVDNLNKYASGGVITAMNTTGAPLNTLRGIVSTWAPPGENNTEELIARAVNNTGFAADQVLDMKNPDTLSRVTEAIIRNENGNKLPVARSIIEKAVADGTPGRNSLASRLEYIDKSNAPPEVKDLARQRVKSEVQEVRVNQQHQRQIQTQADKDADDALELDYTRRFKDPSITMQGILEDPRWRDATAAQRTAAFFRASTQADPDNNTNNNNSIELFRRITLPEGDPMAIRTREPLDQALISKAVNRETYDKLRKDLKEEVVGGGQAEINKSVSSAMAAARPFIRPFSANKDLEDYRDKDAASREALYMRWVQDRVKAQIDSGKDWRTLFKPTINGNPNQDYVRSPENLAEFKPQEPLVRNGAKDTPAQRAQAADDFTTKAGIKRALDAGKINRVQAIELARKLGADIIDDGTTPVGQVPVR